MLTGTIRDLFDISISAEKEARELYTSLSRMFGEHTAAKELFSSMAADEAGHISDLEKIRISLGEEQLEAPAPLHAMAIAKSFLNYSAASVLEGIRTLEDAYKAAVNLEFSEINKLNELLVELNTKDTEQKEALSRALREHQKKLTDFKNSGADMGYLAQRG